VTELNKITKRTLDVQAADVLRAQIAEGRLDAGHRLTEVQLAEEFGLSRGTIRAALKQLVAEGLVSQAPYRGWEVAPISSTDAYELQTLRSSLEGLAAKLAAERLTEESQAELLAAYAELEKACRAGDSRLAAVQDFNLHTTIVRLSGHRRLREHYEMISTHVRRYIFSSDALLRGDMELLDQHRPIVDAIVSRDPVEAEAAACEHNNVEGKRLVAHLVQVENAQAAGSDLLQTA